MHANQVAGYFITHTYHLAVAEDGHTPLLLACHAVETFRRRQHIRAGIRPNLDGLCERDVGQVLPRVGVMTKSRALQRATVSVI